MILNIGITNNYRNSYYQLKPTDKTNHFNNQRRRIIRYIHMDINGKLIYTYLHSF